MFPSSIRLQPFRKEHVAEMHAGPRALADLTAIPQWDRALAIFEQHGRGVTIRHSGQIIACVGLLLPWPGLGEVWVLASVEALMTHRKSFHQTCRWLLPHACHVLKLRRIQADVDCAFSAGRKWAERCGFRAEGEMPAYGPRGETYVRFVYFPKQDD